MPLAFIDRNEEVLDATYENRRLVMLFLCNVVV